jgi:hypothetical protein
MMIKVAAVSWDGAGWELTGAGADPDRLGEPGRGVAAEFSRIEQSTAIVGKQSGEQHLIAAVRIKGFRDLFAQDLAWYEARPVSQLTRRVSRTEQAGEWHDHSYPPLSRTPHKPWCATSRHLRCGVDRFADRLTVPVDGLQLGAKQLTCLRVNVFDL